MPSSCPPRDRSFPPKLPSSDGARLLLEPFLDVAIHLGIPTSSMLHRKGQLLHVAETARGVELSNSQGLELRGTSPAAGYKERCMILDLIFKCQGLIRQDPVIKSSSICIIKSDLENKPSISMS